MGIFLNLATLALRQALPETAGQALDLLAQHLSDHTLGLTRALESANDDAWHTLEVALAGPSWWNRVKGLLSSADDRAFRDQVQAFLDSNPLTAPGEAGPDFRRQCLQELRRAREQGLLRGDVSRPHDLAERVGSFARFAEPQRLVEAEWEMVTGMAVELRQSGFENLARLLEVRPPQGLPLLVTAVRYFFRRSVEEDERLFRTVTLSAAEALSQSQRQGLDALAGALHSQGERIEGLLRLIQDLLLDVQAEMAGQTGMIRQLMQQVLDLQRQLGQLQRPLKPGDSLSLRNGSEREAVKELLGRYRSLPVEQQHRLPALLNALAMLEMASGEVEEAWRLFRELAGLLSGSAARAEAHFNAYLTALERRDWDAALVELREAARLDAERFAPFPVTEYTPERILGAGGFGVAFLCRHAILRHKVVVKALRTDDLDRDVADLLNEAHALEELSHEGIIRLRTCGYADRARTRPYLVMDHFDGPSLAEYVRQHGALTPDDLREVALQTARALQAAHQRRLLHRDIKPANLLVRREEQGWRVKLIDFGLALRHQAVEQTVHNREAAHNTVVGSSIAGTLDYAAPEQLGKLPGVSAGPSSDVYGFGRTCCYALFQTPQPLPSHWRSIPEPLVELLEACLQERPERRPRSFAAVLKQLGIEVDPPPPPPPPPPPLPPPPPPPPPEERLQELEKLAQQVAGCTRCTDLASSRTQTVFGAGPLDPEVLFLGEAPDGDEDRQGQPFVGASGQLLMELLTQVGLRREEVYFSNMIKCRPPGNRPPQAEELSSCREYLDRQIELIRPRFICTLGPKAAQALLGSPLAIPRLRSRFHEYRGRETVIPVMCTYHPADLLPGRRPERLPQVIGDLQKLLHRMGRSDAAGR